MERRKNSLFTVVYTFKFLNFKFNTFSKLFMTCRFGKRSPLRVFLLNVLSVVLINNNNRSIIHVYTCCSFIRLLEMMKIFTGYSNWNTNFCLIQESFRRMSICLELTAIKKKHQKEKNNIYNRINFKKLIKISGLAVCI